jgi:hypothetical protein
MHMGRMSDCGSHGDGVDGKRPSGRVGEGLVVETRGSKRISDPYKTLWGSPRRDENGLVMLGSLLFLSLARGGAESGVEGGFLTQAWTKPNLQGELTCGPKVEEGYIASG